MVTVSQTWQIPTHDDEHCPHIREVMVEHLAGDVRVLRLDRFGSDAKQFDAAPNENGETRDEFDLGSHKMVLCIIRAHQRATYRLEIDGMTFLAYKERYQRRCATWLPVINGFVRWVVYDKGHNTVWADQVNIEKDVKRKWHRTDGIKMEFILHTTRFDLYAKKPAELDPTQLNHMLFQDGEEVTLEVDHDPEVYQYHRNV